MKEKEREGGIEKLEEGESEISSWPCPPAWVQAIRLLWQEEGSQMAPKAQQRKRGCPHQAQARGPSEHVPRLWVLPR